MGAIAPSGRQLARAIVDAAQVAPGNVVIELGGGSGSFTRELVARHPENPLTVFELSADLAAGLRREFPSARVVAAPVEDFPKVAPSLGISRVDRIISGLPWALWGEARQAAVLDALTPYLAPSARFVTFHYLHSRSLGRVSITKRLLREAMRGILPEETRTRIAKTGWNAPAHIWFSGDNRDPLMDLIASRAFRDRGVYIPEEVDRIEREMATAAPPVQWTMNSCLAAIGIHCPEERARALAIGEELGVYRDYPVSKGCTSPFAPIWIGEMVRRAEVG